MADAGKTDEDASPVVEDEKTRFFRINKSVLSWRAPLNEFDNLPPFDSAQAWEALLTLPSCQELMIRESNQRRLNLLVGVNVTQEFPWKQLPYRNLRDNLFDDLRNGQTLYNAFQGFDVDNVVLVGYVPLLTQDLDDPPPGDPFIMYVDPADAKIALAIIRNLETYERLVINRRLYKMPRAWASLGSEDEVNLTISQRYHEPIDVEIQSVYPLKIPAAKSFNLRLTADVRDGYVELIPTENARFENVARRRITVGIQSAMQRIEIEQQTDPTFPTNAWAQYFYEINEDEDCLDSPSEDEEEKKTSSKPTSRAMTPEPPKIKPPPEMSENIAFLLKTLEFNQIDMYRNDYPLISNISISHHTTPYLEETLCFAKISKSQQRFVCNYDWYPALAGLIVTSYTFSTPATIESVSTKIDHVQRAVLQPNPILMWSFDDNLNYKLEFDAPLEVTSLSFCPYDANVLLGGTSNGQIILWDLQNRAERLDYTELMSSAQTRYRILMNEFLNWTIQIDEDILVFPATLSKLEHSQKGPITSIKWLGRKSFVNSFGKIGQDFGPGKGKRRFFMTACMDGTISFWDLDSSSTRKASANTRKDLPKVLTQSESHFKGKVMMPVFTIAFSEPLTGMIGDTPEFKCITREASKAAKNVYNYRIETVGKDPAQIRQSCVISTYYGRLERISWLGLYTESDGRELITNSTNFARVHDGPIIMIKRNPFYPWLFASIGRQIVAVWKEDYHYSPIFWRKRQNNLTAISWSDSKPSVFYLTRIDGSLEAWDILSRDDDACLNDVLGGGIVTQICEHKPQEPDKLLGIGDYNSSLRMVKLPKMFYLTSDQEVETMRAYILKEESRKKNIQLWEQKYYERNMEVIEAKRQAEKEATREMERIEKDRLIQAARDAKREEEAKRDAVPTAKPTFTERMKRQWYEVNLNRLLYILMTRKRVNEKQLVLETRLEKERLAYEQAKKTSLVSVLKSVGEEVAAVRLRIYPLEIPDVQRTDMIQKSVVNILQTVDTYQSIEEEIVEILNETHEFPDIEYSEFLHRGDQRRRNLDKSLGGNTERAYWYDIAREEHQLSECNWGLDMYTEFLHTETGGSRPQSVLVNEGTEGYGHDEEAEYEAEGDEEA